MSRDTLDAVVAWQRALNSSVTLGGAVGERGANGADGMSANTVTTGQQSGDGADKGLEIIFHGGEPLVVGPAWFRMALPRLRHGLGPDRVRFSIQSNLWLLTEQLCELFREHGVSVGTSLDGPADINDVQRGVGSFARTMAGIELARRHDLPVGVICTVTSRSAQHVDEIFDFFVAQGLDFGVHPALPSLHHRGADRWSLDAKSYGDVLVGLLDRYLASQGTVRISTLDSMARGLSAGRGEICIFGDCLGEYLAIGPDGLIYPCQRFAGMAEFAIGDVGRRPGPAELRESPAWRAFAAREENIAETCGGCPYLAMCRGGCPYAALTVPQVRHVHGSRDPICGAYRRTFNAVTERAMAEVFSPENLRAAVERSDRTFGLLQRGRLLSIMTRGARPREGTPSSGAHVKSAERYEFPPTEGPSGPAARRRTRTC
jgi:uncharacterized protein